MFLKQHYNSILIYDLISKLNYKRYNEINKLDKIILNINNKNIIHNKQEILSLLFALELISGQKGIVTKVKKSISNFKIKEKMNLGCKIYLNKHMSYNFLNYIIIILPKFIEFIELNKKSFHHGIFSIGIPNILVFLDLEFKYSKFINIYGMNFLLISNKNNNLELLFLLSGFQIPIK